MRIKDTLLKLIGILADATPELPFQIEDPPFEPVGLKVFGLASRIRISDSVFKFRPIFGDALADSLDLLADERFAQSNF